MPEVRLSTTSYVVLGVIALHGPATPYGVKRAVAQSVGHLWPFPHAQLYSEPDRLADLGLLVLSTENEGRRRKTYSLTGPGLDAVRDWLVAPTDEPVQVRDVAGLKLFFHEIGEPGDVVALAAAQAERHRQRIAVHEGMIERFDPGSRMIAIELGLEIEHAALRFWSALADGDLGGLRRRRARGKAGRTGGTTVGESE